MQYPGKQFTGLRRTIPPDAPSTLHVFLKYRFTVAAIRQGFDREALQSSIAQILSSRVTHRISTIAGTTFWNLRCILDHAGLQILKVLAASSDCAGSTEVSSNVFCYKFRYAKNGSGLKAGQPFPFPAL
ncbi:hypothetical protein ACMFMG_003205 [Clarireedia jacksonii]